MHEGRLGDLGGGQLTNGITVLVYFTNFGAPFYRFDDTIHTVSKPLLDGRSPLHLVLGDALEAIPLLTPGNYWRNILTGASRLSNRTFSRAGQ